MRFMRSIAMGLVVVLALAPTKGKAQNRPGGWVGIVMTTGIGTSTSSGGMVFNDYPVVESVDPGSPAQRAGFQSGDIILSLNSQDLRKNPIPLQSILVPGQKVVFRYKRDDRTRTLTLTVAERPVGTSGHTEISIIGPAPAGPAVRGRQEVNITTRTGALMSPGITLAPMIRGPGSPSILLAGAELTQLNDGLREALRVKGSGVFVVNVAMGTPAGEAGLKSGDVIVRVNAEKLETPSELAHFMRVSSEPVLRLHVVRGNKQHAVMLRW